MGALRPGVTAADIATNVPKAGTGDIGCAPDLQRRPSAAAGRVKVKVLPRFGPSLWAHICPPVGLDEVAGDGQPDAATAAGASAGTIYAIEAVEDMGQVLGGDAGAVVAYGHRYERPVAVCPHLDMAAGRRVLQRVAEDVREDLADAIWICADRRHIGREFGPQRDLLVFELGPHPRKGCLHELAHTDRSGLDRDLAGLDTGQLLQVGDQPL